MAFMTIASLSQSSKCGAHFLASLQCLYGQLVDPGAFFADLHAFINFVGRNHYYTIQICHDEVSGVDRERLGLLR